MSTTVLQYSGDTRARPSVLAQKTARGFAWLIVQTLGSKAVNVGGQVVLAYLLLPEHFGWVGLAYTVTTLAGLLQQAGLREILIHRHRHFGRWATAAFWMSLASGCLSALAMLAAAPIAAHLYEAPEIVGLIMVMAVAAPIAALDVVPEASLQNQLRFRLLAVVNWTSTAVQMLLSVALALIVMRLLPREWRIYGAYAFVLPRPAGALLRTGWLWLAARPPVRARPQVRRWRFLMTDSASLIMANLFLLLTWQGDYMIMGYKFYEDVVGIYYFAFNLSIQTMVLLTGNLASVLFPALTKLQDDPPRQTQAFLRASHLLAMLAVPVCLLQAALAHPGIYFLFTKKWYPAIEVLQILSLGMALRVVGSPGGSLIQAQGRFRTFMLLTGAYVAGFLTLVIAASSEHWAHYRLLARPEVRVALAVSIYFALMGPVNLYVAIRAGGGRWADVWRVYAAPLLAGVLSIGPAYLLALQVPAVHGRSSMRIAITVVVSTVLYIPLIRRLAPEAWHDLLARATSLYRGRVTPAEH